MASIDLPRALKDYFAFAETTATRNGRRFSITLSYVRPDGRMDRLQWWYHLSGAQEKILGDGAAEALRADAVSRFLAHIDQWLQNTGQILYGTGAFPQLANEGQRVAPPTADPAPACAPDQLNTVEPGPDVDAARPASGSAEQAPESGRPPAGKTAFG